MKKLASIFCVTLGLGVAAQGAALAGDAANGEKVFRKCSACHTVEAGKHKVGPSLHGIIGKQAGTVDGFDKYSNAMKESGLVWDDATLRAYLADPRGFLDGTRMAFRGIRKPGEMDDLMAYLEQATR